MVESENKAQSLPDIKMVEDNIEVLKEFWKFPEDPKELVKHYDDFAAK